MATEQPRSRPARRAAEEALVRVVHHYGETPEFVVLGGLVPELLCDKSGAVHAGTTDIDVQVDLEIAAGATNATRLERALRNAEFESTDGRTWRWQTRTEETMAIVKFELLADLDDQPANATVNFAQCDALGAVNLRGTRFASRDFVRHPLSSKVGGVFYDVEVNVTGVAGFLLAKAAAAYGRRKEKDWYDIAFVLLHFSGVSDLCGSVVREGSGRRCCYTLWIPCVTCVTVSHNGESREGASCRADRHAGVLDGRRRRLAAGPGR
jgi:hypothetical protein